MCTMDAYYYFKICTYVFIHCMSGLPWGHDNILVFSWIIIATVYCITNNLGIYIDAPLHHHLSVYKISRQLDNALHFIGSYVVWQKEGKKENN